MTTLSTGANALPDKLQHKVFGRDLAPAQQAHLLAIHPRFDETVAAQLLSLVRAEADQRAFVQLVIEHGTSSLVYGRLASLHPTLLADVLSALRADALAATRRAVILVGEMKRLVGLLQTNGIETLVLKGPALAYGIYGSLAARAFMDLDLMVRPADLERAWAILAAEGFTSTYNISRAHLPALMDSGNHLPLVGAGNHELVELHWAFFPRSHATAFDTQGAWERHVPLNIDDTTVQTLAPRDLIHFLCLHGTKHGWFRASWIADIAWFAAKYPAFDWDDLVAQAARLGTRRMTLVGLALARELFGTDFGARIEKQMRADARVEKLAAAMWERSARGNYALPAGTELIPFVLETRERPRDALRDLYYHLMMPRPDNLEALGPLAGKFQSYRLHRVWYLLRKYTFRHAA